MKIDAIKKVFKKIIIILCCLMLFLFPPKLNDDFVFQDNSNVMEVEAGAGAIPVYLTWEAMKAAAVAAGSAVAPVAIGVVGAAAIGWVVDETIGWDVVASYGQGIINNVLSLGGSVDDIYDAESETVMLTPEMIEGAASAADEISARSIVDANGWQVIGNLAIGQTAISVTVPENHSIRFRADIVAVNNSNDDTFAPSLRANYKYTSVADIIYNPSISANTRRNVTVNKAFSNRSSSVREYYNINNIQYANQRDQYLSVSNLRYIVYPNSAAVPDDVIFGDDLAIKDDLPSSVEDRKELMINNIGGVGAIPLQDNQAVTGVTFPEMVSATQPEDIDEGTANDLGILGILSAIYNFLKTLPARIVSAFTSLFNMIINAIKAIPDAISSGIDNLLININAVGSNIRAGIDDLLIDINGVGANIRAGIDNLLINVSAIPDSIASGIDNLLINMGDWTDSLINTWVSGLGVIIGGINDIWSWLTGFGEWLINLVVPTSLDALQPSIAQLTGTFNDRFAFIITPIKSFGNAYSQSKSLYDVTFRIKYRDFAEDVHVLPIAYKPAVDVFRLVANGVVVVLTYISMYNRFRKEVIAV